MKMNPVVHFELPAEDSKGSAGGIEYRCLEGRTSSVGPLEAKRWCTSIPTSVRNTVRRNSKL